MNTIQEDLVNFILDLAHKTPVPGGGSLAAHSAACACALVHKVFMVWSEREDEDGEKPSPETLKKLLRSLEIFMSLENEDAEAYIELTRARQKGSAVDIFNAAHSAVETPLRVVEHTGTVISIVKEFGSASPLYLRPDLRVSVELLSAAHKSAVHIASANLRFIEDEKMIQVFEQQIADLTQTFGQDYRISMEFLSGHSRYSFSDIIL